jgi:dihydropteroate synthase
MRGSNETTSMTETRVWKIRDRSLPLGRRTLIMGIVNVTPDSFSDGGQFLAPDSAIAHGRRLVSEGADILDIGGESTRPGSDTVADAEEIRRVVPVISALRDAGVPISIDTRKPMVAKAAIEAGASIINDVAGFRDPGMAPLAAATRAGAVVMHMRGEPKTMQTEIHYDDVVAEVRDYLAARALDLERQGVKREAIVLDPGIGFGKRSGKGIEDNALLLKHIQELRRLGYPVLIGASRKSFIGNILKVPMGERVEGSVAAAVIAAWQGAEIVRVHDVRATRRAIDLADAVRNA